MLTEPEQVTTLLALKEGDVIEYGTLFTFAPQERMVWKCEEVVETSEHVLRYTFHVYVFGIMLRAFSVLLDKQRSKVRWKP